MSNSANNSKSNTSSKPRSTNLKVERLPGKPFYVNLDGIKEGMRGNLQDPTDIISSMGKGTARKLRKALRRAGYVSFASASRIPTFEKMEN